MTQLGGSQDKCNLWLERCASVLEFSRAELDSGLESCLCPQAAFREDMRQVASSAALDHIQPLILEDLKVEVSFDMFFGTQFWDPEVDLFRMVLELRCVAKGSLGAHRALVRDALGAHQGFIRARRGRIEASLEASVSQPPELARLDQAAQGQSGASLGPARTCLGQVCASLGPVWPGSGFLVTVSASVGSRRTLKQPGRPRELQESPGTSQEELRSELQPFQKNIIFGGQFFTTSVCQTRVLRPPHFQSLEGGRETHKQKLYVYILLGRILWHCLLAVGAAH